MTSAAGQFEIAKPTGVCAATGRALAAGESCIAALCERVEDAGFTRLDYSLAAWDSGTRPNGLYSYWRTVVPAVGARRHVFADDELLRNLFDRLADDPRPQRVAFRFVLAMVLLRKRLLKYVGRSEDDGIERWLMHWKGSAESEAASPLRVVNPRLSDDDVRMVSDQLGEILNGDLE